MTDRKADLKLALDALHAEFRDRSGPILFELMEIDARAAEDARNSTYLGWPAVPAEQLHAKLSSDWNKAGDAFDAAWAGMKKRTAP